MKSTTFLAVTLSSLLAVRAGLATEPRPVYLDPAAPLEARVEDLLGRMTFEEKLSQVHGNSLFTTAAIPRLGIPERVTSDGPHGVREENTRDRFGAANRTDDFATAMPAGIALAATWDPALGEAEGAVIGEEARDRGKDIMLGPGVNILRTPLCGRNFEYLGEDPWLAGRMAVGYIRGEQSKQVAACVKHFAANNQETQRGTINVEMDERALREIYLPAFRAAVQEGGVWTVMGAYNQFRGEHCCHNAYLLNDILKGEWGFRGLVMSDWGGTHDTRQAALNGLDLEMGTRGPYDRYFLAAPYRDGLTRGEFPMAGLDDKVRRSLRVMIATHGLDQRGPGARNTKAHQEVARRVAEEAIVLLKNEGGALPLDPTKIRTLAVIGDNATRAQSHGGDSSEIKPLYEITPLEGILRRVGRAVNVTYALGYDAPNSDKLRPRLPSSPKASAEELMARAVEAAKAADAVIFVGGLNHEAGNDREGSDRKDLTLPYGQDALLARIVEANPRTTVVLVGGGPVELGAWRSRTPAVVQAWYGGMEAGTALAGVLFGDVNPSGKLPCTFPQTLADTPAASVGEYPGKDGVVRYNEGLLVGYRWYDTKQIAPLFPFGHGLSYTTFAYSGLTVVAGGTSENPTAEVQVDLANTGTREGAEVVQVYIRDLESRLPRPLQELKGFQRVSLKPGEHRTVSIPLGREAFAYYDPERHQWVAEAGRFVIAVGSSSRDLRSEGEFNLGKTVTWQ